MPLFASETPVVTLNDAKTFTIKQGRQEVVSGKHTAASAKNDSQILDAKSVFLGYPHGPKTSEFVPEGTKKEVYSISLAGGTAVIKINGSKEAYGCRIDSSVLRTSFGGADSAANNAVYDPKGDWLVEIPVGSETKVTSKGNGKFEVQASGAGLKVNFYRDYVRNHLGYFLWDQTKKQWPTPISGWCSWSAYVQKVNEREMKAASRFFSENLKDYGWNVIQMDDGFQRVPQNMPDGTTSDERPASLWSKANDQFPSGLENLAKSIKRDGMVPGIWVGLYLPLFSQVNGYVYGEDGAPYKGPWVNYAVDGTRNSGVDTAYLQTFRDLKQQGWEYFKVDTLRHVIYDNYRKNPNYWVTRGVTMEESFRQLFAAIRKETGVYTLACWGVIPELAGLPDGLRIGEDVGPSYDSIEMSARYIAQFHHLNNLLWRNDPDYMCLRVGVEESRAWLTLEAMEGGHLMVSDPTETYDAARVDMMRRVGPPMMIKATSFPTLEQRETGSAARELMTMDAQKDGIRWTVAARFGWQKGAVAKNEKLSNLGLDSAQKVAVFDFWQEKYLGVFSSEVPFSALEKGRCQVLGLRPISDVPQVVGTNRHIGQGVVDLEGVSWKNNTLSGSYIVAGGRQYSLYIRVPSGWSVAESSAKQTELESPANDSGSKLIRLDFPEQSGAAKWSVRFNKG